MEPANFSVAGRNRDRARSSRFTCLAFTTKKCHSRRETKNKTRSQPLASVGFTAGSTQQCSAILSKSEHLDDHVFENLLEGVAPTRGFDGTNPTD